MKMRAILPLLATLCSTVTMAMDNQTLNFNIQVPGHEIKVESVEVSSTSSWLSLPYITKFGIATNEFETRNNRSSSLNIDKSKVSIDAEVKKRLFLGNKLSSIFVNLEVNVEGKYYPIRIEYANHDLGLKEEIIDGKYKSTCELRHFDYRPADEIGLVCENGTNGMLRILEGNEDGSVTIPEFEISIK
ncbi:MAG: hypothetical protein ACXVLQ_09485 [Bacteriovorax sp.]